MSVRESSPFAPANRDDPRDSPVTHRHARASLLIACAVFFVSGFPALLYQLVWQRSLFMIYGINVESVTIVVTGFMLGLGLGSLSGGYLSKRQFLPLLAMFGLIELGIGGFGAISLAAFHRIGMVTLDAPPWVVKIAPLAMLLLPTLLMGATLPILTQYLVQRSGSVGRSVSLLYFLNTLGSAVACFAAAFLLMRLLGMQGVTFLAAGLNALVGTGALIAFSREPVRDAAVEFPDEAPRADRGAIGFGWTLLLSAASGFIALSYEILWFRTFSFFSASSAMAFALMLGAFLVGIAFGSLTSWFLCRRLGKRDLLRWLSVMAFAASLLGFLLIPAIAGLAVLGAGGRTVVVSLLLVAATAALMGGAFPVISHIGIAPDGRSGSRLSFVYMSNILGSVAGSLSTGFVLMDHLSLSQLSVMLGLCSLAFAAAVNVCGGALTRRTGILAAAIGLGMLVFAGPLFRDVYDKLQRHAEYGIAAPFVEVIETKSGVVTVDTEGMVSGGGAYDGHLNTDPRHDPLLIRPYSVSLVHPDPESVLFIGLAGGPWTQIIASNPAVKKVTVVEINPGYLEVVAAHREVSSVLHNRKVQIVIDDARRWLQRHDERFDVIFQNTTFHFRAHTTDLLSSEYIRLAVEHLRPGGINIYNTTWSGRAMRTACLDYPKSLRIQNHMYVSEGPIILDKERWRTTLERYRIDGRPVLDLASAGDRDWLDKTIGLVTFRPVTELVESMDAPEAPLYEACDSILRRTEGLRPITDDNMGDEWSYWRSSRMFN